MLYDDWRDNGDTPFEELPECVATVGQSRFPNMPPVIIAVEVVPVTVAVLYMTIPEAERLLAELTATLAKAHRGTGEEDGT